MLVSPTYRFTGRFCIQKALEGVQHASTFPFSCIRIRLRRSDYEGPLSALNKDAQLSVVDEKGGNTQRAGCRDQRTKPRSTCSTGEVH
ncbi:hypothetical protein O9929_22125 [Vibrio lentus]|nr:hypothetical protein [Vibrio lentus]